MFSFGKRKHREAQIQALKKSTFKKIDKANKSAERVNDLFEDRDIGITEMIFLATGGEKRNAK